LRTAILALALFVLGCSSCSVRSGAAVDAEGSTAAAAATAEPPPSAPPVHGHFGLNSGYAPEPFARNPDLARDLAALDDLPPIVLRQPGAADLTWDFRHPEPDVWLWEMSDELVATSKHPLIAQLYSHMGMPYFFGGDFSQAHLEQLAREGGGRKAIARYFKDNALDLSDAIQRKHAQEYVTAVVERYRDTIHYWELGSEITREPTLVEMMRYTHGWVKELDPGCEVLMPGMAGTSPRMFEAQLAALDRRLAEGMGAYFDIAGYHDYGPLEGLAVRYDAFEAVLAKHGLDVPIWVSETGTSSHADSKLSGDSTEARQAREVVQRLVILSAKGADVVLWHNYKHCAYESVFAGANLVDAWKGPKPGYHTFKLTVQQLDHYRSVEELPFDGVSLYRFTFEGRAPVYVAWAETSGLLDLSFDMPRARVTHIVESPDAPEPVVEIVAGTDIPVSPSPVFLTIEDG
jgi:hypothetical protein